MKKNMPVTMFTSRAAAPSGSRRCTAEYGTFLATPSTLSPTSSTTPNSTAMPTKCAASMEGHAQMML